MIAARTDQPASCRRLLQRAHRGSHLRFRGVAPGDLFVGEEITAAHCGIDVRTAAQQVLLLRASDGRQLQQQITEWFEKVGTR